MGRENGGRPLFASEQTNGPGIRGERRALHDGDECRQAVQVSQVQAEKTTRTMASERMTGTSVLKKSDLK